MRFCIFKNMKWEDALKDYKYYLNLERGLSKNSVESYSLDIIKLIRFLENNNIKESPISINSKTIKEFIYQVAKVINAQQIVALQELVRRVPVADHCIRYAVELVRASRPSDEKAPDYIREMVNWGAGPRASQYLILAAKARAILDGRHSVAIDDIRAVSLPVMRHRIVVNFHAEAQNVSATNLIGRLLDDISPQN